MPGQEVARGFLLPEVTSVDFVSHEQLKPADFVGAPFVEMYSLEHHLNPSGIKDDYRSNSQVWGGKRQSDGASVAIKMYNHTSKGPYTRELAVLESYEDVDGIVTLVDYGEQLVDGKYLPYVVTPLAAGGTLEQAIVKEGLPDPESIKRSLNILCGALGGLAALHADGIVHRDFKPLNVLVEQEGGILADFETAIRRNEKPVQVLGSAGYTAHEVFDNKIETETDMFGVAVTAYRAVTGNFPFPSGDRYVYRHAIQNGFEPIEAIERNPLVTPELNEAITLTLGEEPGGRLDAQSFRSIVQQAVSVL